MLEGARRFIPAAILFSLWPCVLSADSLEQPPASPLGAYLTETGAGGLASPLMAASELDPSTGPVALPSDSIRGARLADSPIHCPSCIESEDPPVRPVADDRFGPPLGMVLLLGAVWLIFHSRFYRDWYNQTFGPLDQY